MKWVLVQIIRGYKSILSPMLPPCCRFYPSCADYAREAIDRHGVCVGGWLAVKRIARCHPFCSGGIDPVP